MVIGNAPFIRLQCSARYLPLINDGDTGYGNPLNVRRMVREYERAGAAAVHIEDQVFPKRRGGGRRARLLGAVLLPILLLQRRSRFRSAERISVSIFISAHSTLTRSVIS